jgi:hypothetical protein
MKTKKDLKNLLCMVESVIIIIRYVKSELLLFAHYILRKSSQRGDGDSSFWLFTIKVNDIINSDHKNPCLSKPILINLLHFVAKKNLMPVEQCHHLLIFL